MPRATSSHHPEIRDLGFLAVRGTVLNEHVYCQRTGRYSSVAMREMWVRGEDGVEWRLVANAHCAAVRPGHRVEVLLVVRRGANHVLRLRNLDTGWDRILNGTIFQVGGEAGPTAMLVAFVSGIGGMLVSLVLDLIGTAIGRPADERIFAVLMLGLPLVAPFVTAGLLAPGFARRRARLRQIAAAFTAMPDGAAA
ncbi:MAG TPA: hypothetical protein VFH27_18470 [Longimicrobiaceae bacterium]|nr:hypothetical protein [Longimicrobiaceae bacterium]